MVKEKIRLHEIWAMCVYVFGDMNHTRSNSYEHENGTDNTGNQNSSFQKNKTNDRMKHRSGENELMTIV